MSIISFAGALGTSCGHTKCEVLTMLNRLKKDGGFIYIGHASHYINMNGGSQIAN